MKMWAWREPSWSATIFGWALIAACLIGAALLVGDSSAAPAPDPPPGTSKPATIIERDYVCAFTMVKITEDYGHEYWMPGKRRWCKWVLRESP